MSVTIQLRRDTASNWTSIDPTLSQGELGVETDTGKLKFGDGATAWSSLAYWSGGGLPLSGGTLTGRLVPATVALTDAATVAVNAALGNQFTLALGGNRTIAAPSNPAEGQVIVFELAQPVSGGPFTPTFASGTGGYSFGSSGVPAWSTAASALDEVAFRYSTLKSAWLFQGAALGN